MRRCFILAYTIIQIAKELCRVVLLNLEKNRKKIKYCFHCPKGFQAASILVAFSMRKYFDQIVGDLTDKIIEANYDFWHVFVIKIA